MLSDNLHRCFFVVGRNVIPSETRLSPRLLAAFRFEGGTTIKAAWGYYYQSATGEQRLAAAAAGLGPQHMQQAVHYIVGVERTLRKDLAVRLDLYHKEMRTLISFDRLRTGEIVYAPSNDSRGHTDGVDIEATFEDERVLGWINAAFMIAKEKKEEDGAAWHFSPLDQAKTVTVVFQYRFNEHLAANIRALYGSGFACGVDTPGVDDNRGHYPNYTRADVRIQYGGTAGAVRALVYIEIMNLFAHRNVVSFNGGLRTPITPDFNLLLPTIINVGAKIWFPE